MQAGRKESAPPVMSLQDYEWCFRAALLRISALINSAANGFDQAFFQKTDRAMFDQLHDRIAEFVRMHQVGYDEYNLNDEYNAENFFYPSLQLNKGARSSVTVNYRLTKTFLDWSHQRLRWPIGTDEELERAHFENDEVFISACAVNYLVKNLWHNYVHVAVQGITEANYRKFRGEARFDSDFEADNLATLLLLKSYGLPVLARGRPPSKPARIDALLRRNACNLVFQERARHRHQDRVGMSRLERYQDAEWRFFRRICNRLSTALAAAGLAARSLRVFADGEIRQARDGEVIFPKRNVIVEINARRYYTGLPVYVPREECDDIEMTESRRRSIDGFRNRRIADIIAVSLASYAEDIRGDRNLAADAADQLDSLWRRLALSN